MGSPIPLVAQIETRDGSTLRGFMKNLIAERVAEGIFRTIKRPGVNPYLTGANALGQGMTSFLDTDDSEKLYVVKAGAVYGQGVGMANSSAASTWTSATFGATNITLYCNGSWTKHNGQLWFGFPYLKDSPYTKLNKLWYASSVTGPWTEVTLPFSTMEESYPALISHGGYLYLCGPVNGQSGASTFSVYRTVNGSSWETMNANVGQIWTNRALLSDGTYLYLFNQNDSDASQVYRSADGATWTAMGTPNINFRCQPTFWKGYFWIFFFYNIGGASYSTSIYRSTDCVTWTATGGTSGLTSNNATVNGTEFCVSDDGDAIFASQYDGAAITNRYCTDVTGVTWTSVGSSAMTGGDATGVFSYAEAVHGRPRMIDFNNQLIRLEYDDDGASLAQCDVRINGGTSVGFTASLGSVTGTFFDFAQYYNKDYLVIKSESAMYRLTIASGTLTQVVDADYPAATVPGLVYLDGYFFVMDKDGNIWNSANEDCTSWGALDYIAAEFEPDNGKALTKVGNYVCAIGTYSTEFFFDAGNTTGSPLAPVQNAVFNVGTPEGRTVMQIEGSVFFLAQRKGTGQSLQRGRYVAALSGVAEPQKISTPDIDRILDRATASSIRASSFSISGHAYYSLYIPSLSQALVYDVTLQTWYIWTRRVSSSTATAVNPVSTNGTATATGVSTPGDGDVMVITGFTSTNTVLNGTFNVTVPASGTLCWPSTLTGTATGTGTGTTWSERGFDFVGGCAYKGKQLLQGYDDGDVHEISQSLTTDNSVYIDAILRISTLDGGTTANKFSSYCDIVADRASASVLMRVSDNGGSSFTKFRAKSLNQERVRFNRLGRFRRRMMEFRVTDAYSGALEGANIGYGD